MRSYLFIIGMQIVLAGCSTISLVPQPTESDSSIQVVSTAGATINVPTNLIVHPSADDHKVIDNDENGNDLDLPNEYRVEMTPLANINCSPLGITAPIPMTIGDDMGMWGK